MKEPPQGVVPNLDSSTTPPHPPYPHSQLPSNLPRLSWQPVPGSPRGGANPAPPHYLLPPPSVSLPPLCQLRP